MRDYSRFYDKNRSRVALAEHMLEYVKGKRETENETHVCR